MMNLRRIKPRRSSNARAIQPLTRPSRFAEVSRSVWASMGNSSMVRLPCMRHSTERSHSTDDKGGTEKGKRTLWAIVVADECFGMELELGRGLLEVYQVALKRNDARSRVWRLIKTCKRALGAWRKKEGYDIDGSGFMMGLHPLTASFCQVIQVCLGDGLSGMGLRRAILVGGRGN